MWPVTCNKQPHYTKSLHMACQLAPQLFNINWFQSTQHLVFRYITQNRRCLESAISADDSGNKRRVGTKEKCASQNGLLKNGDLKMHSTSLSPLQLSFNFLFMHKMIGYTCFAAIVEICSSIYHYVYFTLLKTIFQTCISCNIWGKFANFPSRCPLFLSAHS